MHIHTSDQKSLDLGFGGYSCNWGLHMCGLYETGQERDDILMGYLYAGDQAGDLQLFCPNEQSRPDFERQYAAKCPCCAEHLNDTERFQLFSASSLYYPNGEFSPFDMQVGLEGFFDQSQKNGKRNVRAAADMSWALEAVPGVEHLMAYESRLNYFIPDKPWVSICLYDVTRCSGAQIMNVLRTHPYTINGGVITENPYFIDPDEFLRTHAPQFLPSVQAPAR